MNRLLLAAVAASAFAAGCAPAAPHTPTADASTSAATATNGSCPADSFDGFLRAFASDAAVRAAHTAPWVKVTDWVDVDETGRGTETSEVPRDSYMDFKLRFVGGRYVHVQHDDMPESVPVDPRVSPMPGGYRVEYIFGMSEGNSWHFARSGDCWRLIADPDPSLL